MQRSLALSFVAAVACRAPAQRAPADATPGDAPIDVAIDAAVLPTATITTTVDSTRFVVREHMLAAGEMQISGEPLAQAMGRDLAGFSRDVIPTDIYFDPSMVFWVDLAGFSTAVESYEYSKQPMNGLAFEYGAGTSLVHAPFVDTDGATGAAAVAHLLPFVQHYAIGSNAFGKWVFPAGTWPTNNTFGDLNPHGAGVGAANPIGWPGIWPTAHVFASFDPTIDPTSAVDLQCSISSDDNPAEASVPLICSDFECDATTLHLRDRATQIDATITPGADGFTTWKYGLWTLNYLQIMHDSTNAAVATVDESDLASVGAAGNTVVGSDSTGAATAPGTFLGSSDIEGFQAQMFVLEVDARADDWLARLSTSDGVALSGFASRLAALSYDYTAPLRWFPARIAVTETSDGSGFAVPSYSLASPNSQLMDLVGVAMGYSEFYALTDLGNRDVGGSQPARAFFDGDPFPVDDQLPTGENTLHDRALAMLRVALVNLDRMHVDPATGIAVDDVTMTGAVPTRGTTIATPSLAYTIVGLRTALRALSSQLELYSNNTPDTAVAWTPLDLLPLNYPGNAQLAFSARFEQLLRAHAALLYDHLTDASGRAYAGWDVAQNAPIDTSDVLDAHTAAIRGLFAAYLATGDTRYRDRAKAVYARIEQVFYDPVARLYAATPAPVDTVTYTPLRFALLQSALRDVYELVAARPGGEPLEPILEERIGRLNKLVLNGWDDRNRDKHVDWPDECTLVVGGIPRGGLQMAERTLSGEVGRLRDEGGGSGGMPTLDREHDCVPASDFAHLPAALADSVTFHIQRP